VCPNYQLLTSFLVIKCNFALKNELTLLKDPDSDVRISAAETLGSMGDLVSAIPELIQLSYVADSYVRIRTTDALEKLSERRSVGLLLPR
jgi:HEAT repeat protein